ncbi:GNAT family N-acetyltransferase [Saccharopolyspora taberi]|uniref:GNAT family N-acetyltransferase n=1 Tax=Saccharopolyspora taberi TaxID=60895 RepID=A0ABN3VGR6_9PSEU
MERPRETLHNKGVGLRRWRRDDLDEMLRVVTEALDHLTPWMPWAEDYDREKGAAFLEACDAGWESGKEYGYAILSDAGAIIGSAGMMARIGPGGLEIGYWLHPDHTGRGVATRAAEALVLEAFRIGADRVEIVHDAANRASGAVPRRLGFTEVDRRPPQEPVTAAEDGVDVVWRLLRQPSSAGTSRSASELMQ